MALVSFISGGYNLHRFSDAIGLVYFVFHRSVRNVPDKAQDQLLDSHQIECFLKRVMTSFHKPVKFKLFFSL